MGNTQHTIQQTFNSTISTITKKINSFDNVPQNNNNLEQIKSQIHFLNSLLSSLSSPLSFLLQFNSQSISQLENATGPILIPGIIQPQQKQDLNNELLEEQEKKQKQCSVYNIVIDKEELSSLLLILQNLGERRRSLTNIQENQKQCIICLNAKPNLMLPCAHAFCSQCMHKYILEKKDKKCPLCRKQYRSSVKNNLYEIVDVDNDFSQEIQVIIFDILRKKNKREVRKLLRERKKILLQQQQQEQEQQDYKMEEEQ